MLKVTQEEADYLQQCTKLQTQSLLWFAHRRGRITASNFHSVCHTSTSNPSESLIQKLLQERQMIKSPAMKWGIEHEPDARKQYLELASKNHSGLSFKSAGLFINPHYPYLGASPDGLVYCECCGDGVIEIKCPYSIRQFNPAFVTKSDFFLKSTVDGMKLSSTHEYYTQIQGQLFVCDQAYCDFICWTPQGIFIERIKKDVAFWEEMQPNLERFFKDVLLPRMMANDASCSDNEVYCYCRRGEIPPMIACDNPECPYKWFHFSCVSLEAAPPGDWYCPECSTS